MCEVVRLLRGPLAVGRPAQAAEGREVEAHPVKRRRVLELEPLVRCPSPNATKYSKFRKRKNPRTHLQ